ncbi:uncharacterized protein LOC113761743 isoform X2 [Coffea eugenioides]|uniref:uncharacterized protein LOC113761743 isoform X2 n=1 Tax=Coffea eugenioides TaxID=49369 RepID=UPI000F60C140|nr:uncharacterized protein LOC113761743 isoform X2 [Coffea eugenioides]
MDRWTGILKVPLHPNSSSFYRVAASLCLFSSTKTLAVPSANAIFFNGDRVEGTGNFVIERLSDVQKIAEILVSKFGSTINAWVIEANTFNGPFAVYKDFIPTVNLDGEPQSYNATGFPASSSIVLLLSNCLKEAKSSMLGGQPYQAAPSASCSFKQKTLFLGFSKGGTVLNQLLTELGSMEVQPTGSDSQAKKTMMDEGSGMWEEHQIIPTSKEELLNSIAEIHYVDVGLNSEGAYLTNQDVIEGISDRLTRRAFGMRIILHGTPRQWSDRWRTWICKEKNEFFRLLKLAARKNMGKLMLRERFYFADRPPSLQMHFEIIENLDVS